MTEQLYDVIIIGAGPAGLQAAINAVRKKATVLVLGRPERSSLYKAHIENYLCVDGVREGAELLALGIDQVKSFGAEYAPEDVLHVEHASDTFAVRVESGKTLKTRSLIFATGTSRKKLKVKGEKELSGKGVSYCVDCDANFFRNAKVVIVGNESAAVDGALTMLGYASEVHLITRELLVSKELHKKLSESGVKIHQDTWVKEILGENSVEGVLLENGAKLEVEGVFIELGAKGALELATTIGVQLDSETFTHIDCNKKQKTNITGVYAAGDITGHPYQMAKAVGEGCVAGWEAANYSLKQKRSEN
ncbi:MAG: FAD-dependent oxidoreductase [Deltaproteobacteria bacterium]|jgi:thioredoxin reductase (NADPH)|nr:FAD-dependent oxidoreductase [Deltaproteobacteria bacterium]